MHIAGHDDIETIVGFALANDFLGGRPFPPVAGAQDFPDFRMRKIMEKPQAPQDIETLPLIDCSLLTSQFLEYAGQVGGKTGAVGIAFPRILVHGLRANPLEVFRDIRTQLVDRLRGRVNDLVQ